MASSPVEISKRLKKHVALKYCKLIFPASLQLVYAQTNGTFNLITVENGAKCTSPFSFASASSTLRAKNV